MQYTTRVRRLVVFLALSGCCQQTVESPTLCVPEGVTFRTGEAVTLRGRVSHDDAVSLDDLTCAIDVGDGVLTATVSATRCSNALVLARPFALTESVSCAVPALSAGTWVVGSQRFTIDDAGSDLPACP